MKGNQVRCDNCHHPRPRRPGSFDVGETQFERRPAVRWHSPSTLARAGSHALMFKIVGSFSDQRDTQRFLASAIVETDRPLSADGEPAEEIWIDYFADSGDGFEASATVAWALAQETLPLAQETLPLAQETLPLAHETLPLGGADTTPIHSKRGSVLIQGGDAVYPVAETREYEDRFTGPMRAMLDHTCDHHPLLLAVPGNHDWMDGLNAWSKIMTQKGWVGGWRTAQERSYFATKVSDRWWILGVDAHLGEYLDEGQVDFFRKTAQGFEPGTQVILCIPTPTWVHQSENPEAHQVIDYLIRKAFAGRADVRLILTGDLHHYSRYEAAKEEAGGGTQLITAGGGGAFLSATHGLPDEIELPTPESRDLGKSEPVHFVRSKRYPSGEQSKAVGRGFASVLWRNGGFPAMIGLMYLALGWNALGASPARLTLESIWSGLIRPGTVFWLALTLVMCHLATKTRIARSWVVALPHLVMHMVAFSGLTALSRLVFDAFDASDRVARSLGSWGVAGTGAILGTLVASFAFFLADRRGLENLFLASGLRSTHYRNFIRLRIDATETLTIFPIGIDDSPSDWSADPDGRGSWFRPETPIQPFLIEPPIVLRPLGPDAVV